MAENQQAETKQLDLDQLVQKKREARKKEIQEKKKLRAKNQKQKASGTKITLINYNANNRVIIKGLHKVTPSDVQQLVNEVIHVKNVKCSYHNRGWTVYLNNDSKAAQLVKALNGTHCKESNQALVAFIKK